MPAEGDGTPARLRHRRVRRRTPCPPRCTTCCRTARRSSPPTAASTPRWRSGSHVDVAVGDFDSVSPEGLAAVEAAGGARHPPPRGQGRHRPRARPRGGRRPARRAARRDRRRSAAPRGRLDHLLAGLLALAAPALGPHAVRAHLGPATVHVLHGPGGGRRRRAAGATLTLVPVGGVAERRHAPGPALPAPRRAARRRAPRGASATSSRTAEPRIELDGGHVARRAPRGRVDRWRTPMKRIRTALVALALGAAAVLGGLRRRRRRRRGTVRLLTHDSFVVSDDVLAEFTEADRLRGRGRAGRRRRSDGQPGDPDQGPPRRPTRCSASTRRSSPSASTRGCSSRTSRPSSTPSPTSSRSTPSTGSRRSTSATSASTTTAPFFDAPGAPPLPGDARRPRPTPPTRDLLVVEDPATSSPGLAFVAATVETFGEDGWEAWWTDLRANGVDRRQRLDRRLLRRVLRRRDQRGRQAPRRVVRVEPGGRGRPRAARRR